MLFSLANIPNVADTATTKQKAIACAITVEGSWLNMETGEHHETVVDLARAAYKRPTTTTKG